MRKSIEHVIDSVKELWQGIIRRLKFNTNLPDNNQSLTRGSKLSKLIHCLKEYYMQVCNANEIGSAVPKNGITLLSVLCWSFIIIAINILVISIFRIDPDDYLFPYAIPVSALSICVFYLTRKKHKKSVYLRVLIPAITVFLLIEIFNLSNTTDVAAIIMIYTPFYFMILFGLVFTRQDYLCYSSWRNYFNYVAKIMMYLTVLITICVLIGDGFSSYIIITLITFLPLLSIYFVEKKIRLIDFLQIPLLLCLQLYITYRMVDFIIYRFDSGSMSDLLWIGMIVSLLIIPPVLYTYGNIPSHRKTIFDYFLFGSLILLSVTIFICLEAAIHKLFYCHVTPNRVSGFINLCLLLILCIGMIYHYFRFLFKKKEFEPIQNWITTTIPAFMIWVTFMILSFPVIFYYYRR